MTREKHLRRDIFLLVVLLAATAITLAAIGTPLARVADIVAVITAPLAVAALVLAVDQLARTARAAEAATAAVEQAATDFVTYRILAVISEVHRIAESLDHASDPARLNPERMREALLEWNRSGGELKGLLEAHNSADATLLTHLTETFALATTAKEKLMAGTAPSSGNIGSSVRKKISEVTAELGVLSGTLQTSIGQRNDSHGTH